MRTQQEAERAEQQRIKNLVLNYDLRDENESDGDPDLSLTPNLNKQQLFLQKRGRRNDSRPQTSSSLSFNSFDTSKTNFQLQQNKSDNAKTLFDDQGGLEKHNTAATGKHSSPSSSSFGASTDDANGGARRGGGWTGYRKNGQPRKMRG